MKQLYTYITNKLKCWRYGHETIITQQQIPNMGVAFRPVERCNRCGKWWTL